MNLLSVICLLPFIAIVDAKNLPEKFFGTFSLDRSENFDDYLYEEGKNRSNSDLDSIT